MSGCQVEVFTLDSTSSGSRAQFLFKGVERAAIVLVPIIDDGNKYRHFCEYECVLKLSNIYTDLNTVIEALKLIKSDNISCLIALCRLPIYIASYTIDLHRIEFIELCSGSVSISKHRYDSMLKCISYSDVVIILTKNSFIPKPIANIVPLAKALNARVCIINL